ncbi:ricin-type beta-trefoil lectin domain protein [Streptomyces gardneri]|uniref:ricin-type beta-trefoil lectin domain protein n=1 Tax=Streptomyces gardneri TaxID=66892 RepID=UPI00368FC832
MALSALLAVTLLPAQAWAAPPGDRSGVQLPALQQDKPAALDQAAANALASWAGAPAQPPAEYEPSKVTPPPAGSVDVPLGGDGLVQAGSLPVSIGKASPTEENPTPPGPSGTWSVAVEARPATEAAGVDGAIITVTPPAEGSTPVDVQLDYRQFEDLYGTEWASRLELKQLPECFLTTPTIPECTEAIDVPSTNDPSTSTVRATIDPATAATQGMATMSGGGPVVLAASDSASGAGGTYKATPLAPSGSWSAGGNGGGFSWTYPLTLPAPPAGPVPQVVFSYSSQLVDGKTSVANGQASWIGDGWDYDPGFVERRYRSCSDDRKAVVVTPGTSPVTPNNDNAGDRKKGDLCWAGDSVVMSLGGSTTELVHDKDGAGWVPADDDGTKVEHRTDPAVANGARGGEYWVVTTRDGTRYHFGRHELDGPGGRPVTDSVFTVPVFGNHPGEPCHQATYAASSCAQAWRWNLDYVEDVHGNAVVVDWAKETNRYAKNEKFKEKVAYERGGHPLRVDYGLRVGSLGAVPAARVEFGVSERCVQERGTECSDSEFESKNYADKQPWWDTPSTLHCGSGTADCYVSSPTFWSRKRLTSVTTYAQRVEGSTELLKVDGWTLAQSFPKQRTDTHPPLWLESVTRTGYSVAKDASGAQQSLPMPAVSFLANKVDMPNRVAKSSTDATPDYDRLRVETIRTESGGEISVDYSAPCTVGTARPKPEENTGRCYPVRWSADSDVENKPIEWFNKYVVDEVVEKDRVARQPDIVTHYTYEGDAAWAKDTDEFTKPDQRTYNQWRGYASVLVAKGVTAGAGGSDATEQSRSRIRYFRGMSGDAGRAPITVKDSTGTVLADDLPPYAGLVAETVTYTGPGETVATREVNRPRHQRTAVRTRDGTTPLEAFRVGTERTDRVQAVSGGRTRILRVTSTFDTVHGLVEKTQSEALTPDGSGGWTTSEQSCQTFAYVHNAERNLVGLPQRATTRTGDCTATTGTVLFDSRTSYDVPGAFGQAPVRGLPAQVDTLDGAGTGWVTRSRTEYDPLGRPTKVTDAHGKASTTAYTPAAGQVFATTVTNAAGHSFTTRTDPGRGTVVRTVDANDRAVTSEYDALGRVTAVWSPSQTPGTGKAAQTFGYQVVEHAPPTVTSGLLRDDGTYEKSVTIYDGLLRPRQVQQEAPGGGRLVTDSLYNANGTVRQTNNNYYALGEPTTEIFVPETVFHVPNSTETAYDALGRPTRVTTLYADEPQNSTTYRYEGDSTLVRSGMSADGSAPLTGSRSTRTWTDALGRTSRIEHATSVTDPLTWTGTDFAYDARGNRSRVVDAAGNSWTYGYDARGRLTTSVDPDMGASAFGYDDLDRQVWSQDSAGRKHFTAYDVIGRKTQVRDDAVDGPLVASFTYDTLPGAKGQPAGSTQYTGGAAFTREITGYDAEYRPTGHRVTIPDTAATRGLAGSYAYGTTYTPTGKVQTTTLPATPGGLAAERLVTRYDTDGLPTTLSGLTWYTADTVYGPFGDVLRTVTGSAPRRIWTTRLYDENTGLLQQEITDRETANPYRISALSYTYDVLGNITSVTDAQPGGVTDRQCYTYDPLGRLTEAWTGRTCAGPVKDDVTAGANGTGYRQSYGFDAIGNRTRLTDHDLTDETKKDVHTYTYGVEVTNNGSQAPTLTKPHALARVDVTRGKPGSAAPTLSTYGYDNAGNTTRRTVGGDTQTLQWNRRNQLESVSSSGLGAVAVTGLAGKCLDVEGGRTAENTPVQIYTCNETMAQQWRLTGDTVRALGKCLTQVSGKAVLATCDGTPKQKFTYRPADKTLYNAEAGACLDISQGDTTDGADLLLWACNGGTNQQWTYSGETTYLYDAEGNRLVEETGSGRTLYLGETEITVDKAGNAVDAVRYYSSPGSPTTVRRTQGKATGHLLYVMVADHHGTATSYVNQYNGQPVTRRSYDPFGNTRGTKVNWPDSRAFLGTGDDDTATGLTHLGAREYDPTTGRFLSVDPVIDMADPLQMNGYAYANGDPVTQSDASGLESCYPNYCSGDNGTYGTYDWTKDPKAVEDHEKEVSKTTKKTSGRLTIQTTPPAHLSDKGKQAWRDALKKVESKGAFWGNAGLSKQGLANMSEMFWKTFCAAAGEECPSEQPSAESTADFGLRTVENSLGATVEPQQQASAVAGLGTAAALKLIMDPEHLRGQTEAYVDALAKKAGMDSAPMSATAATGGRGTRYFFKNDKTVQIMFEVGDPESTSSDKVHRGPYAKYQIEGAGKNGAFRVPLAGNPHPTLGGKIPTSSAARMMEFMGKLRARKG